MAKQCTVLLFTYALLIVTNNYNYAENYALLTLFWIIQPCTTSYQTQSSYSYTTCTICITSLLFSLCSHSRPS